jgi:short-subunit dehydrogenase
MSELEADTPLNTRRRAVIVGASKGIGAALAWQLAADGYAVALVARSDQVLKDLADRITTSTGRTVWTYRHDVTDTQVIPALFQQMLQDLKRIDVLVYNAGVMPGVAIDEFSHEKDQAMIAVHMTGGLAWLAQAATLFERMGSGHIVGISSIAADRGRVINPGYNATKAGFDTYLEALRNRLTRKGVHVLTVRPGPVDTDMTKDVGGLFMVSPENVATDIARALRRRKQVLYTPRRWRLIMGIVRRLPSPIFRRMNF